MNVFERDIGQYQGRIARSDAPEGAFVYELGHSLLQDAIVKVGDYHEVKQTFVKDPSSKFIQASIVITTPSVLPIGTTWEVSASLNAVKLVRRRLRPSKHVIKLEDWKISLGFAHEAPASNVLAFRLELV